MGIWPITFVSGATLDYMGLTMRSSLLVLLVIALAWPTSALAQDRMPPIPGDRLTDAQRKAMADFRDARGGDVSGPFVPLLRSPEVMSRARAMGDYLRFRSTLPARLREFVILLTARRWTQQYEWAAHYRLAVAAGLRPEIARALVDGARPAAMAEDEEILYEFCTELQLNQSVSDGTYGRLASKFGEQGVVDTIGLVGYYTMLAMVLNTARTPVPPGDTPPLRPFPAQK